MAKKSAVPARITKTSVSKNTSAAKASSVDANGSTAEQIGFHKGCVMTLAKERQELLRILGIVEQLMQMHASALQEMGVKIDGDAQSAIGTTQDAPKPKKPPIEDIL